MKSKFCVFVVMVLIILFSKGCLDDPRDLKALKEEVAEDNIVKIPADKRNFHWPYFIYIPEGVRNNPEKAEYLLVIPLNSGKEKDSLEQHIESAKGQLIRSHSDFGDTLNVPILVPIFPHFTDVVWDSGSHTGIYVQILNYNALKIDRSMGKQYRGLERVDLQLIDMIDDAIELSKMANISLEKEVLMFGFSASMGFVNRFSLIHPHRVKSAAMGAHAWPTVPLSRWKGHHLPFEAGINDIESITGKRIDVNSFKQIPLFIFAGKDDDDPKQDSLQGGVFREEASTVILENFGNTRAERWPYAERMYNSVGANAEFVLYPNVGHSFTPEMREDVYQFFKDVISD